MHGSNGIPIAEITGLAGFDDLRIERMGDDLGTRGLLQRGKRDQMVVVVMRANDVFQIEPAERFQNSVGIARGIDHQCRSALFTTRRNDKAVVVHHADDQDGHRNAAIGVGDDAFAIRTHQ